MAEGTKEDPWELTTAPGTSAYSMWKDEAADPPTLVCQVGSTQLKYQLRAIDDLHAWLVEQGDWVDVGAADEQKPAADGTVEALGPRRGQPGRRLVRPAQGLPRPVRHVPAAAARGARQGRADPREAQQQGPRAALTGRRGAHRRALVASPGPLRPGFDHQRPLVCSGLALA